MNFVVIILLFIISSYLIKRFFFNYKVNIDSKNKKILVTGAANGIGKNEKLKIGKHKTEELIRRGCFVYATDVNIKGLKEIYENEKQVKYFQLDVTKQEDIDRVYEVN
jgi:NAD(P)-dependent dehydrogenase (short-subunit alcohol dehydrogenase family)